MAETSSSEVRYWSNGALLAKICKLSWLDTEDVRDQKEMLLRRIDSLTTRYRSPGLKTGSHLREARVQSN